MGITYVVSGYFAEVFVYNGFHAGHIKYIRSVMDMMDDSDRLVIIVNNLYQRQKKYSDIDVLHPMFGVNSDKYINDKIKYIYPYWNVTVRISQSRDMSVKKDLEELARVSPSVVFVKDGGEYNLENLPEKDVRGVEYLFLKNPKEASARDIILNKSASDKK